MQTVTSDSSVYLCNNIVIYSNKTVLKVFVAKRARKYDVAKISYNGIFYQFWQHFVQDWLVAEQD